MFVVKHAFLNLTRQLGSYLLAGIIFVLLLLITMTSSTILTSTQLFIQKYTEQFTPLATITSPDLRNLMREKKITTEQYKKFGQSKYVSKVKEFGNVPIVFSELKTPVSKTNMKKELVLDPLNDIDAAFFEVTSLIGMNTADIKNEFAKKKIELAPNVERINPNECIVSEEFAEINHLNVGDGIQFEVAEAEQAETYKLKVVGIYQVQKNQAKNSKTTVTLMETSIYTTLETLATIKGIERADYLERSYELTSLKNFDPFVKELREKGLPKDYQVVTNEVNLDLFLTPVKSIRTLAKTILAGTLLFGSTALGYFTVKRHKKAKSDLYVLRSIGISKYYLIGSHCSSLVIISSISFLLAILLTSVVVQPLLTWQLAAQQPLMGIVEDFYSPLNKIESLPIVIDVSVFKRVLGNTSIFLLTVCLVDSYKIYKFEPIDFLLERKLGK